MYVALVRRQTFVMGHVTARGVATFMHVLTCVHDKMLKFNENKNNKRKEIIKSAMNHNSRDESKIA